MQYVGVTERNAQLLSASKNEICYDKCMVQRQNTNQVLIFVHSRAETGERQPKALRLALERDGLSVLFAMEAQLRRF
jgi:pre-mRNA-splicing helicase BRR2